MSERTPAHQQATKASGKGWAKRTLDWLLGFHGTPDQVARGMAIGVFVAFTPLMGLQMLIALCLATITYSNRPAAAAMVWITNPLTAIPLYLMTYRIGRYFTPNYRLVDLKKRLTAVVMDEEGEWLNLAHQLREVASLGTEILVPLTVGGAIVGVGLGLVAYVLTRSTLLLAQRGLAKRQAEKQSQSE